MTFIDHRAGGVISQSHFRGDRQAHQYAFTLISNLSHLFKINSPALFHSQWVKEKGIHSELLLIHRSLICVHTPH